MFYICRYWVFTPRGRVRFMDHPHIFKYLSLRKSDKHCFRNYQHYMSPCKVKYHALKQPEVSISIGFSILCNILTLHSQFFISEAIDRHDVLNNMVACTTGNPHSVTSHLFHNSVLSPHTATRVGIKSGCKNSQISDMLTFLSQNIYTVRYIIDFI